MESMPGRMGGIFGYARDFSRYPSAIFIILANLIPLFSVLFFRGSLGLILLLYWAESGIIGVMNVIKMATCQGPEKATAAKAFIIPFFIMHYGIFMTVHLMFLIFFLISDLGNVLSADWGGFAISLGALLISHSISLALNYFMAGEYKAASPDQLMIQPYSRIIFMHLTIIFGGFFIMRLKNVTIPLAALIGIKTAVDAWLHFNERTRFTANDTPVLSIVRTVSRR
jgi:hypothetical protein